MAKYFGKLCSVPFGKYAKSTLKPDRQAGSGMAKYARHLPGHTSQYRGPQAPSGLVPTLSLIPII